MTDPENPKKSAPPPAEDMWADAEGEENVIKLTAVDFDKFIQNNPSVLVMFYAPCKYNPEYIRCLLQAWNPIQRALQTAMV